MTVPRRCLGLTMSRGEPSQEHISYAAVLEALILLTMGSDKALTADQKESAFEAEVRSIPSFPSKITWVCYPPSLLILPPSLRGRGTRLATVATVATAGDE